jgi:hypothetical protein
MMEAIRESGVYRQNCFQFRALNSMSEDRTENPLPIQELSPSFDEALSET